MCCLFLFLFWGGIGFVAFFQAFVFFVGGGGIEERAKKVVSCQSFVVHHLKKQSTPEI